MPLRGARPRTRGAGQWVALLVGLVLLAVPSDTRRREHPEFAPVALDHLFTDDLNLTAARRAAGEDDEVCLGSMCWNSEAKAALSNIVRAYLRPQYGVNPGRARPQHQQRLRLRLVRPTALTGCGSWQCWRNGYCRGCSSRFCSSSIQRKSQVNFGSTRAACSPGLRHFRGLMPARTDTRVHQATLQRLSDKLGRAFKARTSESGSAGA
jgi:hypothetical protein